MKKNILRTIFSPERRGGFLPRSIRTTFRKEEARSSEKISSSSHQTLRNKEEKPAALRRTGRKSRMGAILLLVLSVILLVVSYRYPNIVAEVDSVVAFAAAIVLIYKDTTHSIQLRVVDRILDSSRAQISQLASLTRFPEQNYYVHELKGEKVTDVFVVPSSSSPPSLSLQPEENKGGVQQPGGNHQTEATELIPPGRSLSEIFLRELAKENPDLQDLAGAMQPIFSESLGLAFASSMQVTSQDSVSVKILQPVLKNPCVRPDAGSSTTLYSLVCVVCSLLAVLICYASKRSVSIEACHHDAKENITTI
ncbi:MAG: hypothetical protein ACREBS_02830, partial [Nitrososphaerales archaeon]